MECPTGSGTFMNLKQVAVCFAAAGAFDLNAMERDDARSLGRMRRQADPNWQDYLLFYEYFHGETGKGMGASHQTGWTGLVTKMIDELSSKRKSAREVTS